MVIHRALSSLPSKPALVIAPLLALAVLVFYYSGLRTDCQGQAAFRVNFEQQVEKAHRAGDDLVLAETTDFPWDHVKGFEDFRPEHRKTSCPFGWDWSKAERQAMTKQGLLSVLLYFKEGALVRYVEFRNDRVSIEEFATALTPETAVFRVEEGESAGTFRLKTRVAD